MNLSKFEIRMPKDGELCVYYKPGSKFHGHVYRCKYKEGRNGFNYVVRNYTLLPIISSFTKAHTYQSGVYSSPDSDTWPPEMFIVNDITEANYIIIIINELKRLAEAQKMYRNKQLTSIVRNNRLAEKQLGLFC